MVITYTDQNNNQFYITSDTVNYSPITPAESSSGTYSGGEKATITIDRNTFTQIVALSEEILRDTKFHKTKREMQTAVISIKKGDLETKRKTIGRSEKRKALEMLLRSLLEQG